MFQQIEVKRDSDLDDVLPLQDTAELVKSQRINYTEEKQQLHVHQDRGVEVPGHHQLPGYWIQLQSVPEGLWMYGEWIFPLRVDDLVGETERQPATTSRRLLQNFEERQHFSGGVSAVPRNMGRQQHDQHERVPDMVQQLRRGAHVGSHIEDVPVLPEPERGHL